MCTKPRDQVFQHSAGQTNMYKADGGIWLILSGWEFAESGYQPACHYVVQVFHPLF